MNIVEAMRARPWALNDPASVVGHAEDYAPRRGVRLRPRSTHTSVRPITPVGAAPSDMTPGGHASAKTGTAPRATCVNQTPTARGLPARWRLFALWAWNRALHGADRVAKPCGR